MSDFSPLGTERSKLESLGEDELFANLAQSRPEIAAQLGVAAHPQGAFLDREEILGQMHAAGLWDDIVARGKAVFNQVWNEAQGAVCAVYAELAQSGSLGELLDEAAKAVATLLGLPGRVAYLVARAAIKAGLDRLCGMKAMPVQ